MEGISIVIGVIFWPMAIFAWFVFIRKLKPAKWIRIVGTLLVVGLPLLAALSLGQYMFLDEPLYFAVNDGNVDEVKSLLAWGASPDADFNGGIALVTAAEEGHEEIVRLLLAHHARTDERARGQTALEAAQKNGHKHIVEMLKQAGATR